MPGEAMSSNLKSSSFGECCSFPVEWTSLVVTLFVGTWLNLIDDLRSETWFVVSLTCPIEIELLCLLCSKATIRATRSSFFPVMGSPLLLSRSLSSVTFNTRSLASVNSIASDILTTMKRILVICYYDIVVCVLHKNQV